MTNIRSTILAGAGVAPLILGSAAGKAEVFNMKCFPDQSAPYSVSYDPDTGFSHITGSRTGFSRPYHAFDVTRIDNVLYVAVKAPRQTRVLYLAFGYARSGLRANKFGHR
jgi:hypothetical protein